MFGEKMLVQDYFKLSFLRCILKGAEVLDFKPLLNSPEHACEVAGNSCELPRGALEVCPVSGIKRRPSPGHARLPSRALGQSTGCSE